MSGADGRRGASVTTHAAMRAPRVAVGPYRGLQPVAGRAARVARPSPKRVTGSVTTEAHRSQDTAAVRTCTGEPAASTVSRQCSAMTHADKYITSHAFTRGRESA